MYYNARWYDGALGHFAQADSIVAGGVQGWDRYAYTRNNPLRYTDPSGHDVCDEDGNCYNSQGWYRARGAPRLSTIETWRMMIRGRFGVNMSDGGERTWGNRDLRDVYRGLENINDALNGRARSLVAGATFRLGNFEVPADCPTCTYRGRTRGTTITFYTLGGAAIEQMNIYHEFGHLLDNSRRTLDVFSRDPGINDPDFLDDEGYLDYAALIDQSEDMYQNPETINTDIPNDRLVAQQEHWGDIFANYVAGNINLASTEGQAMNTFVKGALAPYIGAP